MKEEIVYSDFEKLDLRVGRVIKAEAPDWSEKLLRYEVDLGAEIGVRVMFSGIRKWYAPEDLVGKQFVFLVNMAPKKMGEEESCGMMIMADIATAENQEKSKPVLLQLQEEVGNGTVVR